MRTVRNIPKFSAALALLCALALCAGCAFRPGAKKAEYPDYSNYVNDTADMVSPAVEQQLNALAAELDRQTGAQVAVLTVPTTEPETLENYAVGVFQKWGIGQEKEDNGVLLLIAPENPSNSRIRIEVGYGLEGALTDIEAKHIITDIMAPACKANDFDACIAGGVYGIAAQAASEYDLVVTGTGAIVPKDQAGEAASEAAGAAASAEGYESSDTGAGEPQSRPPSIFQLIIYGLLAIGAIILFITNPQLFLLLLLSGRGGGGGWSGGDRGGFGGGFGGFGGGMSGGGGASGGW